MEQYTAMEQGGVAVIVTARDFETPEAFRHHPQLLEFQVGEMPEEFIELLERVPPNARIVVIAGELPAPIYAIVRKVAERRNIPYVQRRNATAVEAALEALFPARLTASVAERVNGGGSHEEATTTTESGTPQGKGWLTAFLKEQADLRNGNAAEARRLLPLILQRGKTSTLGSIAQALAQLRRKGGIGERPKSAMSAQQRALAVLDEALVNLSTLEAALGLVREYVSATESENLALKEKLANVATLLG